MDLPVQIVILSYY